MKERVLIIVMSLLATLVTSLSAQDVDDFDADGKADIWVYRPSSGTWFWLKSSTSNQQYDYKGWGVQAQGDLPVVGDFDGDGIIDPTVYRAAAGTWFILKSSGNFTQWFSFGWGQPGDIPVPGDYDGDGVTDGCVFRPATGVWYLRPSAHPEAAWSIGFGMVGDMPVAEDYDGDHRTDIAVYRPSTGTWFVLKSESGFEEMFYRGWGADADVPVPGDYDGDGKADLAVYRPVGGGWIVLKSSASYQDWSYAGWGDVGDLPAPGDFDGDGRTDYVVFRPSSGTWYVRTSNEAVQWSTVFGRDGDLPLGKPRTRVIGLSGNLAFGGVQAGTTATRTLTISNSGNSLLTVTSIRYPTGFSGSWSGTIAAGGTQPVTVTFAPTGTIGYDGTVTVNANQTSGANTIAVSGVGTAAPTRVIGVSGNLAFGNVMVGATKTAQMTISNSGNASLTVGSISYPPGFSGSWSGTIAAGETQSVTVTFAPTGGIAYGGIVTVNANQTSGAHTIAVSGIGTAGLTRVIGLSGNLAFGSVVVGTTKTAQLTITNTGNATLTVTGMTGPSGFSANWQSGAIAAGASQPVSIGFSPTTVGSYSGTITVIADHTSGTNTIQVSGMGIGLAVTRYYVWGGSNYLVYLGYFECTFCEDYGADSINNQFGTHGSQFSSTSIRNQFSQYGSAFSSYSACNEFAFNPPRVYNASATVYYGELTINAFRVDRIASLASWLTYDVCNH